MNQGIRTGNEKQLHTHPSLEDGNSPKLSVRKQSPSGGDSEGSPRSDLAHGDACTSQEMHQMAVV
eukprot:gene26959-biopygen6043